MPRDVSLYTPGDKVIMTCYREECEEAEIHVVLGKEYDVQPTFTGNGRFRWGAGTHVRGFDLRPYQRCPHCNTSFASVIIAAIKQSDGPVVFGYDPEPA